MGPDISNISLIYGCPGYLTIHVVCALKGNYVTIITAYIPSMEEWEENYKKRKKHEDK